MTDERFEKVDLRLKVPRWIFDALKEYCNKFGSTPSATIAPLIMAFLGHSSRARHISSRNMNIYSIPNKNKEIGKLENETHSTIPENFSPPEAISEEFGIDHKQALEIFMDWAKSQGHEKADWDATFRNACRTWIKERLPEKEVDEWEGIKRL